MGNMSTVGGGDKGVGNVRLREAIVEVSKPGQASQFYRVSGNNEMEFRAVLSVRHMNARIIAVNDDQQFRGKVPIALTDQTIEEAKLNSLGFKLIAYPVSPSLAVIPAKRPEPDIDRDEATKLLTFAADPATYYNHILNTTDTELRTLNSNQIRELFAHQGYTLSDDVVAMIREQSVPYHGNGDYDKRDPQQQAFMMAIAKNPDNLASKLVTNGRLIQLFDAHHQPTPAAAKASPQTAKPGLSARPTMR